MKRLHFTNFLLVIFLLSVLAGCKPDTTDKNGRTDLVIRIGNKVGAQDLQYGVMIYTNEAGNKYKVNLLKYYLSNFIFIKEDGTEYKAGNYELIDAFDTTTCLLQFTGVPNGTYTKLKFSVGIDSVRNHTGLQEGDLDPIHGMIWTWNTGYIFFKHEGQFLDQNMMPQQLLYHYGTDQAYTQVQLTLPSLELKSTSKKWWLNFDLNKLYSTPNIIDFNNNNIHESIVAEDDKWKKQLRENFPNTFSFVKAE